MRHPNGRREAAEANEDGKPRGYISLQQYRQEVSVFLKALLTAIE